MIVSDAAGLGEMVSGGGWLVEPGDPGQLAGLLNRLAGDPAEVRRIAEAADREAANRHVQAAVIDGLSRAFAAARTAHAARAARNRSANGAMARVHGGDV